MDARIKRERTFSQSTGYESVVSANSDLRLFEEEYHVHRRWFIGPMPEKVVIPTQEEATRKRDISQLIKEHALSFFLQQGGKIEDWGEDNELSTREEMLQKWRDSEWADVLRQKYVPNQPTQQWVGNSFEVGNFVGVNVLAAQSTDAVMSGVSSRKGLSSVHLPLCFDPDTVQRSSFGLAQSPTRETFVTASTSESVFVDARESMDTRPSTVVSPDNVYSYSDELDEPSTDSGTPLISPERPSVTSARTEVLRRPIMKMPSSIAKSDGALMTSAKVKGKQRVHYEDKAQLSPIPSPVPAIQVLERSGHDVEDSSAGSMTVDAVRVDEGIEWGDVTMRDRMLVRVSYSKSEGIGLNFDEYRNRMTSGLQYGDWSEFMVVWRRDRLEIYEDYSLPGKERLTRHKHLAFVVPLKSGRTKLSMYSFIDMTFCITCPPTPTTARSRNESKIRGLFHSSKQGTNIFVFKVKTRSRALDWIWQLWVHTGGQLPKMIQVRNPSLDTKVKIDIPNIAISTVDGNKMFTRSNIIRLCMESLHTVSDWKDVVERQIQGGRVLELAWRIDTNLDWIWLEDDVYNEERPWVVLCGLALQQSHLEIRLGDHYPSKVPNPVIPKEDATPEERDAFEPFVAEPPAIEGYVQRVHPNNPQRQHLYLATYDGNLFVIPANKAHPPSPFLSDDDQIPPGKTGPSLRDREVARGAAQIWDALGVNDLRSIILVRRAETPSLVHKHTESPTRKTDEEWFKTWTAGVNPEASDHEDAGGEEHLAKVVDKTHVRMRRSFELLLTSGRVIRFECHSSKIVLEWIVRLRALVTYWTMRHRCDAKDEMEVASARRPRLTPRQHIRDLEEDLPPMPPPDPAAPLPALSNLYNWCVLQGCKSIIRGGKVHMRRGLHGQYKMAQMFLISGSLVMFRIAPDSGLHPSMKKRVGLADAYICSGYFAALALPRGQYDPEKNSAPRHYQDGLEADDPEEDTLFMIWYRKESSEIPALSKKRKLVVFRTRSKLERDTWCWALNTEIERLARAQKDKEAQVRDAGGLRK